MKEYTAGNPICHQAPGRNRANNSRRASLAPLEEETTVMWSLSLTSRSTGAAERG